MCWLINIGVVISHEKLLAAVLFVHDVGNAWRFTNIKVSQIRFSYLQQEMY